MPLIAGKEVVGTPVLCYFSGMTTVAEIEHAIEALPARDVSELARWIEEHQLLLTASADVFSMLDAEEGKGEQWSVLTRGAP